MIVALWIIAICEIIRIIQYTIQLLAIRFEEDMRKMAVDEYVKSLHKSDAEFIKDFVKVISTSDAPVADPKAEIEKEDHS